MAIDVVTSETVNAAAQLAEWARRTPQAIAVAEPRRGRIGRWRMSAARTYRRLTFAELEADTNRLAEGLVAMGVRPGTRLAMFMPFGIDFISLVYAVFKSGGVAVLIDPGMGLRSTLDCLGEVRPEGFIAVPPVHAFRALPGGRFANRGLNVTVGRRWFWGGATIAQFRRRGSGEFTAVAMQADDPAAIIFTSGSTGPAKGVLYCHGNFIHQAKEIQTFYKIPPGEIDAPCFPLFGLFNASMGVTTVIPDMDPRHPARVDPRRLIATINDWQATQSSGSPAVWKRVGQYCEEQGVRISTLKRVFSAGAPARIPMLRRMQACIHPEGEMHTPYGATEALPVASIEAREVLGETGRRTDAGSGVCVGRKFPGIEWRVIRIVDRPLSSIRDLELPTGEIGELIVRGPVVTREYVTRLEANGWAKIPEDAGFWHRMGDLGYLDAQDRFWFCGRKTQRVLTATGPMYTIPCEAIFNRHADVSRSALVGIGAPGMQTAAIVVEPLPGKGLHRGMARGKLIGELRTLALSSPLTSEIRHFFVRRRMPVDIRHNAKIAREKLAEWASRRIAKS
ncbi:MAG TPA: fatty acid CoA ligase family protein [Pirellulales bacterium]|nr:fatty acid CoA ligase family protein [Pirellulales bacterium]